MERLPALPRSVELCVAVPYGCFVLSPRGAPSPGPYRDALGVLLVLLLGALVPRQSEEETSAPGGAVVSEQSQSRRGDVTRRGDSPWRRYLPHCVELRVAVPAAPCAARAARPRPAHTEMRWAFYQCF